MTPRLKLNPQGKMDILRTGFSRNEGTNNCIYARFLPIPAINITMTDNYGFYYARFLSTYFVCALDKRSWCIVYGSKSELEDCLVSAVASEEHHEHDVHDTKIGEQKKSEGILQKIKRFVNPHANNDVSTNYVSKQKHQQYYQGYGTDGKGSSDESTEDYYDAERHEQIDFDHEYDEYLKSFTIDGLQDQNEKPKLYHLTLSYTRTRQSASGSSRSTSFDTWSSQFSLDLPSGLTPSREPHNTLSSADFGGIGIGSVLRIREYPGGPIVKQFHKPESYVDRFGIQILIQSITRPIENGKQWCDNLENHIYKDHSRIPILPWMLIEEKLPGMTESHSLDPMHNMAGHIP
ncbi:Hypothetical protein CINCED_3A003245 [Cinara cedri]|uniref:Uncharacterized protein n=1 Tax=Cinara cedri TaxID=506608 RepID=A0A5E4NHZ4_9HEMI|nr:Hypothetical protein CINCED_3A003245 [Cinara cedri]